jgi:RNA polymerase sigma factor (sigma-70 family)
LTDNLENIIKGCKAGKNSAREQLYKLLSAKMWAVCLRYSRNTDEAKDVLQDGFIKVFEKIDQYEGRGPFEGWVRRIMVNTALSEYRKQHYLHSESEDQIKDNQTIEPIEADITAAELMNIIGELPPQYRMVFNLYAVEGYAHKDISELLGISEGTSKSNLSRARDILQKKIKVNYPSYIKLG